jgi:large subunit ribosomal protein L23
MNSVLIRPLITEKSMTDVAKGKYSFVVAKSATKSAIKYAIKTQFSVTVTSIATSVIKGKTQRVSIRRQEVAKPEWKKATVTLKKGEKIALFEPGGGDEKKK